MARVLCLSGSNTDVTNTDQTQIWPVFCIYQVQTQMWPVFLSLSVPDTDMARVLCLSESNTDMANTDQTQIWLVFCIYHNQTQMWPVFSVVSEMLFSQVSSIPVYREFDRNASVVRLVDQHWMLLLSQQAFFSTQRVKPC